ncbi:hypothetical protein J4573_16390 [Actinomadura barringtoniae]|uniref:Uncharacterized protein n=1 Tax=Actinomadura barringtoniae TaxID=1427535 RepID=A0A939PAP6_9ACTN|nr:hypothetical protein [Actinomadura barringtoniae]MBO2448682.1 hypothetical protein [Actinomadura barringtoniae]
MPSRLLSTVQVLTTTGYGMFGFYNDIDAERPEPPISAESWYSASPEMVEVRPACTLPSPAIRFELWDNEPSAYVIDGGDDPEVRALLEFHASQGSIGLMALAAGAEPGVFEVPAGWYWLDLLGYRRSIMPAREADLYERDISPGDPEWERAEGTELYVARLWPKPPGA